jgi:hypothetical protein
MRTELNAATSIDLRYKKKSKIRIEKNSNFFMTNIEIKNDGNEKKFYYQTFKNCTNKYSNDQKRIIKRY